MGSPSTKVSLAKHVAIPREIFSKMESDPNITRTEANLKKRLEAEKGTKVMLKKINKFFDPSRVDKTYKHIPDSSNIKTSLYVKQSLNFAKMLTDCKRILSPKHLKAQGAAQPQKAKKNPIRSNMSYGQQIYNEF